jgi:hypothetical protein
MALGQAADGRIAGHVSNLFDILSDEKGGMAHPGASQGGLNARMASPHHHDVVIFLKLDRELTHMKFIFYVSKVEYWKTGILE